MQQLTLKEVKKLVEEHPRAVEMIDPFRQTILLKLIEADESGTDQDKTRGEANASSPKKGKGGEHEQRRRQVASP